MCGIYGIIDPAGPNSVDFNNMFRANIRRGSRGAGELHQSRGEVHNPLVVKYNPTTQYVNDVSPFIRIMLGHVLAPTNGDDVTVERMHPFRTERFYFAHNGILLNHNDHKEWKPAGLPDVDSVYMLGGIDQLVSSGLSVERAIAYVSSQLKGQFACWLYDRNDANVYLWRCMSTIHVSKRTDALLFSSAEVPNLCDMLVPEGQVYRVTRARPRLNPVAAFAYENIYA